MQGAERNGGCYLEDIEVLSSVAVAGAKARPCESGERGEGLMRNAREKRPIRLPLGSGPTEPLTAAGRAAAGAGVASALAIAAICPMPEVAHPLAILAVVACSLSLRKWAWQRAARPAGAIVIDEAGLRREAAGGTATLLKWNEPFGLTVLVNPRKDRLLFALTSPARSRYVGVRMPLDDGPARRQLLESALVISDEELASADVRDQARLSGEDAVALLNELQLRAAGALTRIYLTATRGEPVELEGTRLRVGERVIDLTAPLEWRAFVFHEAAGHVAALYEATWVRQADAELVLVAPTPGDGTHADEPPPRELRLGIDRLFMLPLRRALEGAPRSSRCNPQQQPRALGLSGRLG